MDCSHVFITNCGFLQVTILLFVCQWLVALMWQWRIDPDNAAIPYLTALGDLVGTTFLFWPSPSFPP
uniref:SLC41A/MgtE integral membrane domain-containing protein n=1 Tax=Ditylenchus dipsaci TaxID=166011 RepID=A0A915DN25_9BILA